MSNYDNSNRVALWFNDKREKQTHPHVRGNGETDYPVWASGWFAKDLDPADAKELMAIIKRHNEASKTPFLSVSLKAKDDNQSNQAPKVDSRESANDFDDDIPF